MSTLHFWPDDIVNDLPVSPLAILHEAATELGRATKGAVEVEIMLDSASANQEVFYNFMLVSKIMNFRYELFYVRFNPVLLYPCTTVMDGEDVEAFNDAEFRDKLMDIVRRPKAIAAVKAMLAQSQ